MKEKQDKYLSRMSVLQNQLEAMWQDSRVQLYQDKIEPENIDDISSLFLAGPTSRNQILEYNWRSEAVALLRKAGFIGWIYCPEPRGKENPDDFTERSYIHGWEASRLLTATHVAFWIPRKADELLGLNTNIELGIFLGLTLGERNNLLENQHLFVGWPPGAERMGLPQYYMTMAGISRYRDLKDLCHAISCAPRMRPTGGALNKT